MELLAKLFGTGDKVKIMRLFVLNPDLAITTEEVARRSRVALGSAKKELSGLEGLNFLRSKTTLSPISLPGDGAISLKKKKAQPKIKRKRGWQLDLTFPFLTPLRSILKTDLLSDRRDFAKRFNHCGKIKLLAIAGIFIDATDSRADLVIVGDGLKKRLIEKEVQLLESEIGKELVYAIFDSADFDYRLNACDKFVRDILDFPHEKIINRGYPQ
ncbi:MAG: hypothetical protein AAB453_01970 [Patescibacteria group bacterium]